MYKINLQNRFWVQVALGNKTVEARLFRDHHALVAIGSLFEITNNETLQVLKGVVTNVTRYNTFESMLINEGLKHVLPGTTTLADGINTYYSIPGFQQGESIYGVVAIELYVDDI
jgi:ASC-1-like (ASCH) protein